MLQQSKFAGNSGLNAQAEEPRRPARIIGNQLSSPPHRYQVIKAIISIGAYECSLRCNRAGRAEG